MKWFKHSTGSHDDPDLSDCWDKFGDAGVVIFWVLLELYGSEFSSLNGSGEMNISIKFMERKMRRRWSAVAPKLGWLQSRGRIEFEVVEDRVKVKIPKFLELASNWTTRKKSPTEAPTEVHTESPTAIDKKKNRIEEEKKKKEGSNFVLPDWVPKESWEGFVEARKKKKGGLTDRAKTLLLNKLVDLRSKGFSPGELLDEAVEKGWMSVYEPKPQQQGGNYGFRPARGNRIPEALPREAQEHIDRANKLARELSQKLSSDKT